MDKLTQLVKMDTLSLYLFLSLYHSVRETVVERWRERDKWSVQQWHRQVTSSSFPTRSAMRRWNQWQPRSAKEQTALGGIHRNGPSATQHVGMGIGLEKWHVYGGITLTRGSPMKCVSAARRSNLQEFSLVPIYRLVQRLLPVVSQLLLSYAILGVQWKPSSLGIRELSLCSEVVCTSACSCNSCHGILIREMFLLN